MVHQTANLIISFIMLHVKEIFKMSIYCLLTYVDEVGKENATFEGLKEWKAKNWRE